MSQPGVYITVIRNFQVGLVQQDTSEVIIFYIYEEYYKQSKYIIEVSCLKSITYNILWLFKKNAIYIVFSLDNRGSRHYIY